MTAIPPRPRRRLTARAAIAIVRAWTRIYTYGLPAGDRERRRAEIESDLWESAHDGTEQRLTTPHIIRRLLLGIVDDLRWRVEAAPPRRQAIAAVLTAAVLLTLVWVGTAARRVDAPQPPDAPDLGWHHQQRKAPAPPPPPPPPCNPPGIGRPAFSPCTPYPVTYQGGRK